MTDEAKLDKALQWLREIVRMSMRDGQHIDYENEETLLDYIDATRSRVAKLEADLKEADEGYKKDAERAEKAEAHAAELEVDLADSYRLRERLDVLLTGIANNLLGYDPNKLHDWSRLPELARQIRAVGVDIVGEHPHTMAVNTRAEKAEEVLKNVRFP